MTEKYKIYIPEAMRSRLMNDAELFEFTKNDGSVNLNAFLKELLVNYFDRRKRSICWIPYSQISASIHPSPIRMQMP